MIDPKIEACLKLMTELKIDPQDYYLDNGEIYHENDYYHVRENGGRYGLNKDLTLSPWGRHDSNFNWSYKEKNTPLLSILETFQEVFQSQVKYGVTLAEMFGHKMAQTLRAATKSLNRPDLLQDDAHAVSRCVAATMLGISRPTLGNWIKAGKIKTVMSVSGPYPLIAKKEIKRILKHQQILAD